MKRMISVALVLLLLCLCGCSDYRTDITREEIISAYEDAGYTVYSGEYDEVTENGVTGYVRADHPNGEYIYFSFFRSEAEAREYNNQIDRPFANLLISSVFGEPTLIYAKYYGCVVVTYDNANHFDPFKGLLAVS